jgi:hypothetical protein
MATLGEMTANVSTKLGDRVLGEFYTAAEIKKAIGDSFRFYYMKMTEIGEGYFETTDDIDLVANQEAYDLTALSPAFRMISQLQRYITTGTVPLFKNEQRYRSNIQTGSGVGDSYRPLYKFRGMNLILMPRPSFDQTAGLKLDYVYIPTFPTSTTVDAFVFDSSFPTVCEVNVEIRAAVKCMETKDANAGVSDVATFRQELAELDQAFFETLERDEGCDRVQYTGLNYNNPWWNNII